MEENTIIKSEISNAGLVINSVIIAFVLFAVSTIIYSSGFEYMEIGQWHATYTLVPLIVILAITNYLNAKSNIVVTNKRVYGTAAFGKRVDLPFDMISAVGTDMLCMGIAVTTASGAIKFPMIKNKDDIHNEISKVLIGRQDKFATTATIKQEIPQSNTEELKKYKELLDSGVITQTEFDAKKKQLLGL